MNDTENNDNNWSSLRSVRDNIETQLTEDCESEIDRELRKIRESRTKQTLTTHIQPKPKEWKLTIVRKQKKKKKKKTTKKLLTIC